MLCRKGLPWAEGEVAWPTRGPVQPPELGDCAGSPRVFAQLVPFSTEDSSSCLAHPALGLGGLHRLIQHARHGVGPSWSPWARCGCPGSTLAGAGSPSTCTASEQGLSGVHGAQEPASTE